MRFCELLNELIAKSGVRASEICQGTGVKKAWLSKLRSGALFPPEWGAVHRIARFLGLDGAEYGALCDAYKAERLSADMYAADCAVRKLFATEFKDPPPYQAEEGLRPPAGGSLIQGEALRAQVGRMLASAGHIRLGSLPRDPFVREILFELMLSAAPPDTPLYWMMFLEEAPQSVMNLRGLVDALPMVLRMRAEVRQVYMPFMQYAGNVPFPMILATDTELFLLDQKGRGGVYLDGEAAAAYVSFFDAEFAQGIEGIAVYRELLPFLTDWGKVLAPQPETHGELYILLKHPCIIEEASPQVIRSHLRCDDETAGMITELYVSFLRQATCDLALVHDFFTEQGLTDLLGDCEYYEFGKAATKQISPELRRELFTHALAYASESERVDYGILYDSFPDSSRIRGLNLWDDGRMIVVYDGNKSPVILAVRDPSIVRTLIAWVKSIRRCGILSTKETALAAGQQAMNPDGSEL